VVLPENAQLALSRGETRPFKTVALTLGRFTAQVKYFEPKKKAPAGFPAGALKNSGIT